MAEAPVGLGAGLCMIQCVLVLGAAVDNSEDVAASGGTESGKVWERPWSITEMRDGSKKWTLAADAGVNFCPTF